MDNINMLECTDLQCFDCTALQDELIPWRRIVITDVITQNTIL
jgi:hypothetical protein